MYSSLNVKRLYKRGVHGCIIAGRGSTVVLDWFASMQFLFFCAPGSESDRKG